MHIQLAWRNLWRNPRRTAVILTAVSSSASGAWSSWGAFMRGVIDQMVENGISTLTGHIQIHHRDYRRDPVIEHRIADPSAVEGGTGAKFFPRAAAGRPEIRVNAVAGNATAQHRRDAGGHRSGGRGGGLLHRPGCDRGGGI